MSEESIKTIFLTAPDSQLDSCMFPLIEKWDEPLPTSLQILEVLDQCIYSALASGFIISAMQAMYDTSLEKEGKTHEDNLPYATWRARN